MSSGALTPTPVQLENEPAVVRRPIVLFALLVNHKALSMPTVMPMAA